MVTNAIKTPLLTLEHITKRFPGVTALQDINLSIESGEVHVLVGENGAGKSTLIKLISGIYQPDEGAMVYQGSSYSPLSPLDAIRVGIHVIHQELNLLTNLSVAENIFFEQMPSRHGLVDFRKLYRDSEALLAEVGLNVSPRTPVEQLGIAQQQLVEIARVLSNDSRLLIMDEPTATLTPREIDRLFAIIARLKAAGVTIIYISHRLQEIYQIGDRVTVLRNGERVETTSLKQVAIADLVRMMVGKTLDHSYPFRGDIVVGDRILQVDRLVVQATQEEISFDLKQREILGIAGLVGSGRTETVRALFGADPKVQGRIVLRGQDVNISTPKDAVAHGLCLLTEDRKEQGVILDMSCAVNITLADLLRVSATGLIRFDEEAKQAERLIEDLSIRTPSPRQMVKHLSGGNQQKIVIAKWLFRNADIFIFDEPTRGIDVGAKFEIYNLLWRLVEQGKSIIMVSSELPELMGICHRILVFSNGRIAGEVARPQFNQEAILSLAYQQYTDARVAAL